jgi:hypothetical protein
MLFSFSADGEKAAFALHRKNRQESGAELKSGVLPPGMRRVIWVQIIVEPKTK